MLLEAEIWQSAGTMIQRYGLKAPAEALTRAEALLRDGNLEGAAAWQSISTAIEKLLAEPEPGDSFH